MQKQTLLIMIRLLRRSSLATLYTVCQHMMGQMGIHMKSLEIVSDTVVLYHCLGELYFHHLSGVFDRLALSCCSP